jgi:enoyl-CoA hydratase
VTDDPGAPAPEAVGDTAAMNGTGAPILLAGEPIPGVRLLSLNRPERLNALTPELVDELGAALEAADADPACRVVVLTGTGRGFCAGFDLRSEAADELASGTAAPVRERLQGQGRWSDLAALVRALRPVVIAAVNGVAAGGGLALALAADLRVAGRAASFVVANVRIGLSGGEMGIAYALPRIVGAGRAAELMLTGRPLPADEALAWGLVNQVADETVPAALALARVVAGNPPFGVEMTKELLGLAVDAPSFAAAVALENRTQVLASCTRDMADAVAAFAARAAGTDS